MEKTVKVSIPGKLSNEPIIYHLAHDFDVMLNISKGRFTATAANLVLVLKGRKPNLDKAMEYLSTIGIEIDEE